MQGPVKAYPGLGTIFFLALPKQESAQIKEVFGGMKRGFGSLAVIASVGKTKWKTSIFPDHELGIYVLPLKADVRKKEKIKPGDMIPFTVEILV